jgi:hypothetical protein
MYVTRAAQDFALPEIGACLAGRYRIERLLGGTATAVPWSANAALYCWGANDKGQLGLPVSSAVLSPTLSNAAATICQ